VEVLQLFEIQLDAATGELECQLEEEAPSVSLAMCTKLGGPSKALAVGRGTYSVGHVGDGARRLGARLERGAEVGEPGEEGHGEHALVLVLGDVDAVVALAQLAPVWVDEEGEMRECRRLPAERLVESQMLGRRDEPLL